MGVVRCECIKRKRLEERQSKIPEYYRDNFIDKLKARKCVIWKQDECFQSVKEAGVFPRDISLQGNLYLAGPRRIGKTALMWEQYKSMINGNIRLYVNREVELLNKLREQAYDGKSHFDVKGSHVFIDELAGMKYTEDRTTLLSEFIDQIIIHKAGLTITSNLTKGDIEKRESLGFNTERIMGRLREICTHVYIQE